MRGRQRRRLRPGRAQARVETADQRPRAVDAVLAEQIEHPRCPIAALARDRIAEGGLREHERLGLGEHAQLGRQAGLRRVLAQQARRQPVDGADLGPRLISRARERALEPQGQLARRGIRIGDDQHALGRRAGGQCRAHALDHERGLAGAGAGGDDDVAARFHRGPLLIAESDGAHGLATLQTPCQRHHGGHSPSGGSCSTSPAFIRPENSAARSPASSSSASKTSGST